MDQARPQGIFSRDRFLILKYIIFGLVFTGVIGIFSVIMSSVSRQRALITENNYYNTSKIYNGPLEQASPTINALDAQVDGEIYVSKGITADLATHYAQNTALVSTVGGVTINADFVKKGLSYQPSYRTDFHAAYVLKNELAEPSVVTFAFPFPANTASSEITNASLVVDGQDIEHAKAQLNRYTYFPSFTPATEYPYNDYGYNYLETDKEMYSELVPGLRWSGEIPANGSVTVEVNYQTVGLSLFHYEGVENPKGAQDFAFVVTINGIRGYDIPNGLSVDKKTFGHDQVKLEWNKTNLYSTPEVSVTVGDKLNPSTQVSRVYLVMTPLYLVAMTILLFLFYRFGKKLSVFDLALMTILYILYFPLVHYLSSFTIDPTLEIFAAFDNVGYFSMPLYGAFAIAWFVIGGLLYYLASKLSSFGFANKFMLPCLILFLGFFPLVLTVPEYSILLTIIGMICLMVIIIVSRLKLARAQA